MSALPSESQGKVISGGASGGDTRRLGRSKSPAQVPGMLGRTQSSIQRKMSRCHCCNRETLHLYTGYQVSVGVSASVQAQDGISIVIF